MKKQSSIIFELDNIGKKCECRNVKILIHTVVKGLIFASIKFKSVNTVKSTKFNLKEYVLQNFANFIEKHLCQSLFLINKTIIRLFIKKQQFVKRGLQHRCFLKKFATFLRTDYRGNTKFPLSILQW